MSELESDMEYFVNKWLTGKSSDDELIEQFESLGCSHFEALEHFEDYGGDFKDATKRTLEMLSRRIESKQETVDSNDKRSFELESIAAYWDNEAYRLERDLHSLTHQCTEKDKRIAFLEGRLKSIRGLSEVSS
jgi:septal ring factor EnvC (AmiA/AmiB activator)